MSYQLYNWIHVFGLFVIFASLGGISIYAATGGEKAAFKYRRALALAHGVMMVLVLVAGFGLMARANYKFTENPWIYLKLLIWLGVGVFPAFVWRMKNKGLMLFWALLLLGVIGSYTAIFKFSAPQFKKPASIETNIDTGFDGMKRIPSEKIA